uniref:Uncharacterized protein n=1 Tax=Vitrella brassicaformis TaxID=1169539 RepID=A0A7S1JJY7_9ALVE|mmetsp:Transcript_10123/g.24534  ORF Transcript_10123/g.24534 Transcript_10123/m.24534 type:complete len:382 (+) Transcript_10123:80-1225(+)
MPDTDVKKEIRRRLDREVDLNLQMGGLVREDIRSRLESYGSMAIIASLSTGFAFTVLTNSDSKFEKLEEAPYAIRVIFSLTTALAIGCGAYATLVLVVLQSTGHAALGHGGLKFPSELAWRFDRGILQTTCSSIFHTSALLGVFLSIASVFFNAICMFYMHLYYAARAQEIEPTNATDDVAMKANTGLLRICESTLVVFFFLGTFAWLWYLAMYQNKVSKVAQLLREQVKEWTNLRNADAPKWNEKRRKALNNVQSDWLLPLYLPFPSKAYEEGQSRQTMAIRTPGFMRLAIFEDPHASVNKHACTKAEQQLRMDLAETDVCSLESPWSIAHEEPTREATARPTSQRAAYRGQEGFWLRLRRLLCCYRSDDSNSSRETRVA